MPPETKFDKGKKFMITTISVEPKQSRPTFTKNNCTHYNYIVRAIVKGNIEPTTFEYASPTQDALDVFVANVPQWVICMQPSDIACNIQPCEPPGEEVTMSKAQYAQKLVDDATKGLPPSPIAPFGAAKGGAQTFNQDTSRPPDLRGHPYAFIYAWAKDLVVAEMTNENGYSRGADSPADPIERISYYAGRIYKDMMQKIQEG